METFCHKCNESFLLIDDDLLSCGHHPDTKTETLRLVDQLICHQFDRKRRLMSDGLSSQEAAEQIFNECLDKMLGR